MLTMVQIDVAKNTQEPLFWSAAVDIEHGDVRLGKDRASAGDSDGSVRRGATDPDRHDLG